MAAPEPSKPMPSATQMLRGPQEFGFEVDFADLAARFAAKSGGGLSAELSAELALEIVLNEIVEQACQVTGATGAAIIIDREGELVCRAASGSTSPQLGSRIDKSSGLAAESLRAQKTLWCDDTFTDSRADADPLKDLGIRSVVIMPLLRVDTLLGIFELFSTQPYAFGVRDERTLETLADRALTNLEHASQPFDAQAEPIAPAADLQEEDLQKIGLQDVTLPKVPMRSSDPVGAVRNASSSDFDATDFHLPDFPLQIPVREGGMSSAGKVDANAESTAQKVDFAFPDINLGEVTAEDIHALLENAGVIPAEPEQVAAVIRPEPEHVAKNVVSSENVAALRQAEPEAQFDRQSPPAIAPPVPPKQIDYVNWALGFAVLSVAVLLGLVLGQHFVLSQPHAAAASSAPAIQHPTPARKGSDPAPAPSTPAAKPPALEKSESLGKAEQPARVSSSHDRSANSGEVVPPGGLLVLENGKEVFRLPPSENQNDASAQQVMQPASELHDDPGSQQVLDIPEATAQRELLHRVEPEYPELARQQNIEGRVVLEVHIGMDGSVQEVETVSGSPILAQASTDAVKQWMFKPRVINGRALQMQTRVTFDFKLPQ